MPILDSRAELDVNEDRQPTKTKSRGQYRRTEDQYPCIEIQPTSTGGSHLCAAGAQAPNGAGDSDGDKGTTRALGSSAAKPKDD